MVLLQFGKEISPDAIDQITSSSPETGSGDSSLTNGHSSLSDVINDWKRELQEKNLELRHTIERLQDKEFEICEIRNECKKAQIERDENCQMVRFPCNYEFSHATCEFSIFKIIFSLSTHLVCTFCVSLKNYFSHPPRDRFIS